MYRLYLGKPAGITYHLSQVYWTDLNEGRLYINGSDRVIVVPSPYGIAIDKLHGYVFIFHTQVNYRNKSGP